MRSVLVTGGSRGLGLAIVTALAAAGYRVLTVARSESDDLRAARAQAVRAGHGTISFHAADLAELGAIPGLVRALRAEAGALYGLVNNAGVGAGGVLGTMRDDAIERLVRTNTLAPILLSKYVVRGMMAAREGRIVNIASVVGATGYSGLSVYAATKASLVGFTRALAREVGQLGITVNAVAPGFAATEMTRDLAPAQRAQIERRSALRRLIEPADVAGCVRFLLSEDARNITGTVLTVDAGNTA
jgi:3-oxoacyl-[acyl-carrier protein] reductase